MLWVATWLGLNRVKDGKITTFTRKDGLYSNLVYTILEDDLGYMWMTCSKGVPASARRSSMISRRARSRQ